MQVVVTASGEDPGTAAQQLLSWLSEEDDLRGRTRLADVSPPTGALGGIADMLVAALAPGTAAVFASVLVAWIRHRTTDTRIRVQCPDGTITELSAQRVKGLTPEKLRTLAGDLTRCIERGGTGDAVDRVAEH